VSRCIHVVRPSRIPETGGDSARAGYHGRLIGRCRSQVLRFGHPGRGRISTPAARSLARTAVCAQPYFLPSLARDHPSMYSRAASAQAHLLAAVLALALGYQGGAGRRRSWFDVSRAAPQAASCQLRPGTPAPRSPSPRRLSVAMAERLTAEQTKTLRHNQGDASGIIDLTAHGACRAARPGDAEPRSLPAPKAATCRSHHANAPTATGSAPTAAGRKDPGQPAERSAAKIHLSRAALRSAPRGGQPRCGSGRPPRRPGTQPRPVERRPPTPSSRADPDSARSLTRACTGRGLPVPASSRTAPDRPVGAETTGRVEPGARRTPASIVT
jgi:hypothetical protein